MVIRIVCFGMWDGICTLKYSVRQGDCCLCARRSLHISFMYCVRLATLAQDPQPTLSSMNQLAKLLQEQGNLDEAEPLCREALAGYGEVVVERHQIMPDSMAMANLASLLSAQGELNEAEPLFREAFEGHREVLGARHPDTLHAIGQLALSLQAVGIPEAAEPLCREAVEGSRQAMGEQHPDTLDYLANLADVLRARGVLTEAREAINTALAEMRPQLGDCHKSVLISRAIQAHIDCDDPATAARGRVAMQTAVADMQHHLGAENQQCREYAEVLAALPS